MTVLRKIDGSGCGCDASGHAASLIEVGEALKRIVEHVRPVLQEETVPLAYAGGRVLSKSVVSRAAVPPFDTAAMDGFAVDTAALAGDGPWRLEVCARVAAGQTPDAPASSTTAVRIFTGARVPRGADAVVAQEEAGNEGRHVILRRRPTPGLNIRRTGEDMVADASILRAGTRLGSREIAATAAAGCGSVQVFRPVRVALLVTGTEIRQAGRACGDAEIWDVNTPMLRAALTGASVDLVDVRQASDDRTGLRTRLRTMMSKVDLIVTTGGISVGEEDNMKPAFRALDGQIIFSGVALKPGKPVTFGRLKETSWLGLPGNPAAAFITWQLFGTVLLRLLSGMSCGAALRRPVLLGHDIRRKPGRCELRPASIAAYDDLGRPVAQFLDATHPDRVAKLPLADGMLVIPAYAEHLVKGTLVEFVPFCES
jgi:molybdopterin molybdotransferase